ncbi:MAG: hypothetical protein ACTHMT_15455 [Verrucomicrobiota bacterium]
MMIKGFRPFVQTFSSFVALVLFATGSTFAQSTPALTPGKTSFSPREEISINFSNGPGNPKDWIGIYLPGQTPGSGTPAMAWFYVDGTRDGAAGLTEGTVAFPFGLSQPGSYVVKFLENDTYHVLASTNITIANSPTVDAEHDTYYTDEPITVNFANGPGNSKDWIGFYLDGEIPGTGPTSTIWNYVDGTQNGSTGFQEGKITFQSGLSLAGDWDIFFLENDGYTILSSNSVKVVDLFTPLIRLNKRVYTNGEPISLAFTNGPGNPKDWIGFYRIDELPGTGPNSAAYLYVDGTQGGNTALTDGTVTFSSGPSNPGDYVAYFLLNDGYDILASERFTIRTENSTVTHVVSTTPKDNTTGLSPLLFYSAVVVNGTAEVDTNTFKLKLDGAEVPFQLQLQDEKFILTANPEIVPQPNSSHEYELTFQDKAVPANAITNVVHFEIGDYRNIVLPAAIYFENFDNVPEGALPTGWSEQNFTDIQNFDVDFGNLDSAAYATWTSVDADRFKGSFVTYSNPDDTQYSEDYHRVLTPNPFNVLDGKIYTNALASGRFLFSDSGYRNGTAQIAYLFTPDFNLTGKTNVYLSFHSIYEQNQDSSGSVEYSIDQGQTWLPIVYMIEQSDVVIATNEDGSTYIDSVATFTQDHSDVAHFLDPDTGEDRGGNYGAFIGAAISQDLAPYISPRIDNNASGSKRIELFRLPMADNQSKVRFRFAHDGTDSWYFGIDDFGLYSITETSGATPELEIQKDPGGLKITWDPGITGYTLEETTSLSTPPWTAVANVSNNSVVVPTTGQARFFRLKR